MNSASRWTLAWMFVALLITAGCSKTVELKNGTMSTGENYRLIYLKNKVPFDVGDLWLKVSRQGVEVANKRLEAGYDLYMDIEASVAETEPGRLLIVERRVKRAWVFEASGNDVVEVSFEAALSSAVK